MRQTLSVHNPVPGLPSLPSLIRLGSLLSRREVRQDLTYLPHQGCPTSGTGRCGQGTPAAHSAFLLPAACLLRHIIKFWFFLPAGFEPSDTWLGLPLLRGRSSMSAVSVCPSCLPGCLPCVDLSLCSFFQYCACFVLVVFQLLKLNFIFLYILLKNKAFKAMNSQ